MEFILCLAWETYVMEFPEADLPIVKTSQRVLNIFAHDSAPQFSSWIQFPKWSKAYFLLFNNTTFSWKEPHWIKRDHYHEASLKEVIERTAGSNWAVRQRDHTSESVHFRKINKVQEPKIHWAFRKKCFDISQWILIEKESLNPFLISILAWRKMRKW